MKHLKTYSAIATVAISMLIVLGLCSDKANSCTRFNSEGKITEMCVGNTPPLGCTLNFITGEKVVCDGKKIVIEPESSTDDTETTTDKTVKPTNP